MGHDEASINRAMFSTFKDRLEFDSLEYHTVLYSADRGYEYNFRTHKIRPFTSVLWFDVNMDEFFDFINYFEERCISAISKFEADGDPSEAVPSCVGYLDNKYIVVDINSLGCILEVDDDYVQNTSACFEDLKKSFKSFFKYITNLYDNNEEFFRAQIDKNYDLI